MRKTADLIIAIALSSGGCQMHHATRPENLRGSDRPLITSIDLIDGRTIYFDEDLGQAALQDSSVIRIRPDGSIEGYPMSEIRKIHTSRQASAAEYVIIGAALTIALVFLLLATAGPIDFH